MKREKLIKYRGKRSQAEMAKMYGVTQQSWCKLEQGESKPGVVIMKKIEVDSGMPMETIFFDIFNNHKQLNA